jgi:hypothetical protein
VLKCRLNVGKRAGKRAGIRAGIVKGEDSEECNHEYQDNQESKCRSYYDNKTKR